MTSERDIMVQQPQVSLTELQQQKDLEENLKVRFALSEKNNGIPRKSRNREITSRYKSGVTVSAPSSARRFASPNVGRAVRTPEVFNSKRAQSVERRRPSPLPSAVASSLVCSEAEEVSNRRSGRHPEVPWPSTRSSSVSNNGISRVQSPIREKFNNQVSERMLKPAANMLHGPGDSCLPSEHKATLERKRMPLRKQISEQSENARPQEKSNSLSKQDHHRWPRTSTLKLFGSGLSKSVDLTDRPNRASTLLVQGRPISGTGRTPRHVVANRAFSQTINEGPIVTSSAARRASIDGTVSGSLKGSDRDLGQDFALDKQYSMIDVANQMRQSLQEAELACSDGISGLGDIASDTESISSGGTSGSQDVTGGSSRGSSRGKSSTRRGTTVPARFWQETTNKLRRLSGLQSSLSESDLSSITTEGIRLSRHSKKMSLGTGTAANVVAKSSESTSLVSRSRPSATSQQSNSPVKLVSTSSNSRGLSSPTKIRGLPLPPQLGNYQNGHNSNAASAVNIRIDVRKGKQGISHIEKAHLLRILHNRLLQWRFVNARAEAAMHAQNLTAEKLLYNVWVKTSELLESVTKKRVLLQQAKQDEKLRSILSVQINYLEDFALLQQDHSSSVSGAIKGLEAATVRLPVTNGARADIQAVKEAVSSVGDVMHSMTSSLCSLLPKVEGMNSLVSELAQVTAQERLLLDECGDLLAKAAALEVEESSLRTHLIQLKQEKYGGLSESIENGAPVD
eukprot:Gb_00551 [translate_table: standard]